MTDKPKDINLYNSPMKYTEKLAVKKLIKMSIKEFVKYAEDVIQPHTKKRSSVGLGFKFPYNLNGKLAEKIADCHPVYKWTAFLNNAGNLCHVVNAEDPDMIIRVKFHYSIKHLSRMKQMISIWHRVGHQIDVGACPKYTSRIKPHK